jgi:DNA-binding response OmpR family regulator
VLLVEPDALVRELVGAGLELHHPGWRVEALATFPEARSRCAASGPLDLVILELRLPDPRRGVELVRALRAREARVPILVLTAAPEEAWRRGLDVDAVVVKPADMDQLLSRVERLLVMYRGSVVRGIGLPTLLQMLEAERKSCTLQVAAGGRHGRLWMREGVLAGAEAGTRSGRAALFAMLDWSDPVIEVLERGDTQLTARDRSMRDGLQSLLLDHAVEKDHESVGKDARSPTEER